MSDEEVLEEQQLTSAQGPDLEAVPEEEEHDDRQPQDDLPPGYERTTVGDLGQQLVVGTIDSDGNRHTNLALQEWTAYDERQIGDMARKRPRMSMMEYTARILAYFTEQWGHRDLHSQKLDDRHHYVASSFAADIFQAWTMLRIDALGSGYKVQIQCPDCGHEFTYEIDLESVPVVRPLSQASLRTSCNLKKGILLNNERYTEVVAEPVKWWTYENLTESGLNDGQMKLDYIRGSVVGVPGFSNDMKLPDDALDSLKKYDIEILVQHCTDQVVGPDMGMSIDCPNIGCNNVIESAIDWQYNPFFSAESISV